MKMDEKLTDIVISINTRLASIDAKIDNQQSQLKDHSERIRRLETVYTVEPLKKNMKDELLSFALKAVIGLVAVVAALTGSGSILTQIVK